MFATVIIFVTKPAKVEWSPFHSFVSRDGDLAVSADEIFQTVIHLTVGKSFLTALLLNHLNIFVSSVHPFLAVVGDATADSSASQT